MTNETLYARFRSDPNDPIGTPAQESILVDPLPPTATGVMTATLPEAAGPTSTPAPARTATLVTAAIDQPGGTGVVAMELSGSPSFAGASWQPYAPSAKWVYDTRARTIVYVRWMDGAGNVSRRSSLNLALPPLPTVPTQVAPQNTRTAPSRRPSFMWLALADGATYQLQVSNSSGFVRPFVNITTTGLSFQPATSLPSGRLYWRVRSSGGTWSPAWSLTAPVTDPPAPATPASAASLHTLAPNLTWAVVTGAAGYRVELGSDAHFLGSVHAFSTTAPLMRLLPLASRASYFWRVRAHVGGKFGPWSAVRAFSTPALDAVSLLLPVGGSHIGGGPLLLDWSDVAGAMSYHVQVCATSTCGSVAWEASVHESLHVLAAPLPSATYWWRVQAVGPGSIVGPWSTARTLVR